MLLPITAAARRLRLKRHHVYYLVAMGYIEAVKVGKRWRLVPEAVENYDKRHTRKNNRTAAGNTVGPGSGGFLIDRPLGNLPADSVGEAAGMERRRRELVRRPMRPQAILLKKYKPVIQLELFAL